MDQQVSLSLEMSEQEEEEADEEEIKTKEVQGKVEEEKASHGKPLLKAVMEMDGSAQGCKSQKQHMIKVKMSSNTPNQRIYDKNHFCLYCEKPYAKISRHLKQKHSGEVEIAKALSYKQGSSMQHLLLTKVRNMGNYHHNNAVLSTGKGEIIPKRQAMHMSTATDYLPCKFFFSVETLQMAKVSRIFLALQNGISTFQGKSLEDINRK